MTVRICQDCADKYGLTTQEQPIAVVPRNWCENQSEHSEAIKK